ncbi:MAG TPA: hypothetical protein VJW77_00795 [Terriglobia bacterium]|nr:hypothetical protein [Terriglobia bacterium]
MQLKGIILAFIALGALVGYINIHDPWFEFVMIAAVMALVSGMPDPREDSSTAYKWAYRSFHLFLSIGTSFFSHESAWRALEPKAGSSKERETRGEK